MHIKDINDDFKVEINGEPCELTKAELAILLTIIELYSQYKERPTHTLMTLTGLNEEQFYTAGFNLARKGLIEPPNNLPRC